MPDLNPNPLPIACNLSGRAAARRKSSTMRVLRGALRVRDIENGYELVFPGEGGMVAGGPIRLRVTGPDGAKELIQEELILAPHGG